MINHVRDIPKEYRENWIRGLLSGEYTQIPGSMGHGGRACAGGVLHRANLNVRKRFRAKGLLDDSFDGLGVVQGLADPTTMLMMGIHSTPIGVGCWKGANLHEHKVAQWNDTYAESFEWFAIWAARAWGWKVEDLLKKADPLGVRQIIKDGPIFVPDPILTEEVVTTKELIVL